eukprot:g20560.t1
MFRKTESCSLFAIGAFHISFSRNSLSLSDVSWVMTCDLHKAFVRHSSHNCATQLSLPVHKLCNQTRPPALQLRRSQASQTSLSNPWHFLVFFYDQPTSSHLCSINAKHIEKFQAPYSFVATIRHGEAVCVKIIVPTTMPASCCSWWFWWGWAPAAAFCRPIEQKETDEEKLKELIDYFGSIPLAEYKARLEQEAKEHDLPLLTPPVKAIRSISESTVQVIRRPERAVRSCSVPVKPKLATRTLCLSRQPGLADGPSLRPLRKWPAEDCSVGTCARVLNGQRVALLPGQLVRLATQHALRPLLQGQAHLRHDLSSPTADTEVRTFVSVAQLAAIFLDDTLQN